MLTKQKTSERKGPNVNKQKTSERKGPNVNKTKNF